MPGRRRIGRGLPRCPRKLPQPRLLQRYSRWKPAPHLLRRWRSYCDRKRRLKQFSRLVRSRPRSKVSLRRQPSSQTTQPLKGLRVPSGYRHPDRQASPPCPARRPTELQRSIKALVQFRHLLRRCKNPRCPWPKEPRSLTPSARSRLANLWRNVRRASSRRPFSRKNSDSDGIRLFSAAGDCQASRAVGSTRDET